MPKAINVLEHILIHMPIWSEDYISLEKVMRVFSIKEEQDEPIQEELIDTILKYVKNGECKKIVKDKQEINCPFCDNVLYTTFTNQPKCNKCGCCVIVKKVKNK